MKRDAAGKFVNKWQLEAKHRFSISLTSTAWRSLDQEAQKREISRSEVIEHFARTLEAGHLASPNQANIDIQRLQNQIFEQQQQIVALQRQKQELEAQLEKAPGEIARVTERKVATILESITDAFVAFDRDWRYTYVNGAAARILHKTPEQLIGKHVWDEVFPELVGGIAYKTLQRAVTEQIPVAWEEFSHSIQSWLEANAYPSSEGIAIYFRDVTERKQAEAERERLLQELETERAQFETVLQQMPAGVLIADAISGKLILANEQAKRISRYDYGQILGLAEYASVTPFQSFRPNGQAYAPHEYPLMRSLQTGEIIINEEMELRQEDGSRTTIAVNSTPILDQQKQILAAVVVFQDITERKQTELLLQQQTEALENQQKWLQTVLDLMPTPTVFIEPETAAITFSNRIANELAGGDLPKNKSLDEYTDVYYCTDGNGDRIPTERMPAVLIAQGKRLENYEMNWYTPGGVRATLCWGEILPAMHGHPAIGIGMFQDVTRLKQIEESLRQTEERLQLALSSAQMIAWDFDPQTRRTVCSPNAAEVWGIQAGNAEEFYTLIYPDDRQQLEQAVDRAIAGDQSFSEEYRVLVPGEDIRWFKSQGRVYLDDAGRATRMTGVSVNITERKQIEAERDRLLEQEQNARRLAENERQQAQALLAELQRKERQQQFLIELNDAVRTIQDSKEIMWQVMSATGQHFNVTRCTYGEIDETQEYVIVDRDYCNGVISVIGKHHLDSFGSEIIAELKQGKTIVVDDVDRDPRTAGAGAAAFDAIQTKSLLCVPLVKQGRFVALLVLHHVAPRHWTKENIVLLERVAEKTWLAVERSRAEEELRESEAHLQLALNVGRMGTWEWNIQTEALLWSAGHFTILGLQPYECEPSYDVWRCRVHPDDLAEAEAKFQRSLEERTEYHHEYRLRWLDGSIHWVEARGQFTYNIQGHPKHSIGAVIDITERKQAEQEREQLLEREQIARSQAENAQQQLETIFETSPIGLALLDNQQRFIAINEALAEINGLTRGQHLGASISDLFGQSDPQLVEVFQQIYTTGEPFISPDFAVNAPGRSDRRPGYYNVYYLPTVNAHQRVESVLIYVVDVTERVRLERAQQFLAEASAVLASSLDYQTTLERVAQLTVPELADWCTVHIVEADGTIDQIAVAHIDPAKLEWAYQLREKYPLDPEAARGAALTLRTGQSDFVPEIPDEMLVQAAHDPEHLEILRQVGFSSVMTVPLRVQERVIGVISFISAESGRRYTAADLQFAEELARRASLAIDNAQLYQVAQRDRAKAEAANRIKDEFLAVLSHELRSPLNPILGWTRLLRTRQLAATKTEQALETIERNARLQAQLIEDLLDVSRILQGKMTLNIAPVDLATTIEAALETVRLAVEAKHIQLQTILNPIAGSILGDTNRLQQVIWNLLSNAVKFTESGGRVTIRLEQVGRSAQIQVEDTGKGISSEFLPHVFDYFRQEDGTTTRQFGGLGLGLAIVRQLTELHGGTVSAESPGQDLGATFTVSLPLNGADQNPSSQVEPSAEMADLTDIKILVVDDEVDMRELAFFILTQSGAQVITAASAAQALTLLDQFVPDLLLCDIGMPEMDGYALIRQIRQRTSEQGGNVPAIALTAYTGEINQQQALTAGFHMHISKPVEPEHLISRIASLVARSTSLY
ncbi:PAS domain S-box protein [Leptolyngbya ohadii]|uniref:PAS domain S-box protein n=1 Tax=Leptolyngbya ohadii TaxID=1962290 RepID=UPI000B59B8CB|nr:PAS domain S-box protein [Leptolyngbya ohadii]